MADSGKDEKGGSAAGMRKGLTSYGDAGFSLFLRKAFIKGAGYTDDALDKPIVGIAATGSGFNPCHGNAPQLIEAVKRGVMLAGGLPMEFPTISIHESFAHPTSMFLRNLMSMDTEEMIRAQPMDAVVLIGGCDKTVPAQLMGAASAGLPAIQLVTGSMLTGAHRGKRVGACTDCRRFWASFRGDEIDAQEIADVNNQLVASVGTCSVMGTASTMACIAEALGIALPGSASPPAVTADRVRVAERSGAQAVAMIAAGLTPDRILTPKAFANALRVLLAIGGSTNGIIHLTAIAGRLGIAIDLEALDRIGRETPVLVDLKPSGAHYMEDFHKAGGLAVVLRELKPLLHLDALTVTGRTLGEELDAAGPGFAQDVIRPLGQPDLRAGRHRGAARQPRAGRRDHQAVRGIGGADGIRRPRGGVRGPRRPRRAHRRSGARRGGRRRAGAEEHRPEGRAGHAGGGPDPDPEEARAAGRQGHGAHLRRAHERHGVGHDRAARDAGVRARRPARRWCAPATASG